MESDERKADHAKWKALTREVSIGVLAIELSDILVESAQDRARELFDRLDQEMETRHCASGKLVEVERFVGSALIVLKDMGVDLRKEENKDGCPLCYKKKILEYMYVSYEQGFERKAVHYPECGRKL